MAERHAARKRRARAEGWTPAFAGVTDCKIRRRRAAQAQAWFGVRSARAPEAVGLRVRGFAACFRAHSLIGFAHAVPRMMDGRGRRDGARAAPREGFEVTVWWPPRPASLRSGRASPEWVKGSRKKP